MKRSIHRRLLHYLALLRRAGFYLAAIMVLLPVWLEPSLALPGKVQDTLFVLDVSESMNVADVDNPAPHTTRIQLAKSAIREAMASLTCGSRVSLALFAGEDAVVLFEPLEICRHFPAMEQVVSRLDTHMRWIGDSRVAQGLSGAMKAAQSRKLNVVFVTDGDEMPHRSAPRLTEIQNERGKVRGVVMAVGGHAPLPVPKLNLQNEVIGYWTQEEAVKEGYHPNLLALVDGLEAGQHAPAGSLDEVGEHLSATNPAYLKRLANAGGLEFAKIDKVGDAVFAIQNPSLTRSAVAERDARWIFGLFAAALILVGWFKAELARFISPWLRHSRRQVLSTEISFVDHE